MSYTNKLSKYGFEKSRLSGYTDGNLSAESIEGTSLSLQSVDYIHSCDCLPLSVFGIGDCVSDDVLKKYFQYTSGLFVDQSTDTLDTSSTGQPPDGRLCDSLDVITKNLAMAFCTSLPKTSSFSAASGHC